MKGTIFAYPSECPNCGEKYSKIVIPQTNEIVDILCKKCNTRPDKFAVDGRPLGVGRIFRDKTNDLIRIFNLARSILLEINTKDKSYDLGRQLYFTKKKRAAIDIEDNTLLSVKKIINLTGFKKIHIDNMLKKVINIKDLDGNILVKYSDLREYINNNNIIIIGDKRRFWFPEEEEEERKGRYKVKLSNLTPSHNNIYSRISIEKRELRVEEDVHNVIFQNYTKLFKIEGYKCEIYKDFDLGIYGIPDILSVHIDKDHNKVINVVEIKKGVIDNLGLMQLYIAMHGIIKALSFHKNMYYIYGYMVGNSIRKEGIKSILDQIGYNISFMTYYASGNIQKDIMNTMNFSLHKHFNEDLSEADNFEHIEKIIGKWDET